MKFKNIGITGIVAIIIFVLLIAYFCFASFSASLGYEKAWTESSTKEKLTIIIDAGHGGIDPGAVCGAIIEKQLNLLVAKKLANFLSLADVNVIMTRNDDILLGEGNTVRAHKTADLRERLRIMQDTENCIFVSIHMNKFDSPSPHGLQTFYASKTADSEKLAACIQNSVKMFDPQNKREIKPDDKNIYILEKATKTAVLVECGFISNTAEAQKLTDDAYQNKLAYVIYTGILNFIQEMST